MIKRIAIFFLVITAVPAIMLSLPVWANDQPLTLTFIFEGEDDLATGLTVHNSVSETTLWNLTGATIQTNEDGELWFGSTPERDEPSWIEITNQAGKKTFCSVKGRTDSTVPLTDNVGDPIINVTVSVAEGVTKCTIILPQDEKKLQIYTYSDSTSAVLLNVYDYKSTGSEIGSPTEIEVKGGAWGTEEMHAFYFDAAYAEIEYGSTPCKYSDGTTEIQVPTEEQTVSVHAQIKEGACILSNNAPPPPAGAKLLNVYAYSDVAMTLHVHDYQGSTQLNDYEVNVAEGDDGALTALTLESKAESAQIVDCAFEDGKEDILIPSAGGTVNVYAKILAGICTLSSSPPLTPETIQITTCDELFNIPNTGMDKDYAIVNDITCSGNKAPIPNQFTGTLNGDAGNGQRYKIYGLVIQSTGDNVGLFNLLSGAKISNIEFVQSSASVSGTAENHPHAALVAGVSDKGTVIENIYANNIRVNSGLNIKGTTGGIVGRASNTTLNNITLIGNLHRLSISGGLIGKVTGDNVKVLNSAVNFSAGNNANCSESDKINCTVGGVIGHIDGDTVIENTAVYGYVDAPYNGGGVVGVITACSLLSVTNSYSLMSLGNLKEWTGGIVGRGLRDCSIGNGAITLSKVFAAGQIYRGGKHERTIAGADHDANND